MRLPILVHFHHYSPMERIVHKARDFEAATEWDIEQQLKMTPNERRAAARKLKQRVYGNDSKDVRECHQTK